METTFVLNGNDDDVIINYITDMDLGEDSDSHTYIHTYIHKYSDFLVAMISVVLAQARPNYAG